MRQSRAGGAARRLGRAEAAQAETRPCGGSSKALRARAASRNSIAAIAYRHPNAA
jgi:hypothetical protein